MLWCSDGLSQVGFLIQVVRSLPSAKIISIYETNNSVTLRRQLRRFKLKLATGSDDYFCGVFVPLALPVLVSDGRIVAPEHLTTFAQWFEQVPYI